MSAAWWQQSAPFDHPRGGVQVFDFRQMDHRLQVVGEDRVLRSRVHVLVHASPELLCATNNGPVDRRTADGPLDGPVDRRVDTGRTN